MPREESDLVYGISRILGVALFELGKNGVKSRGNRRQRVQHGRKPSDGACTVRKRVKASIAGAQIPRKVA